MVTRTRERDDDNNHHNHRNQANNKTPSYLTFFFSCSDFSLNSRYFPATAVTGRSVIIALAETLPAKENSNFRRAFFCASFRTLGLEFRVARLNVDFAQRFRLRRQFERLVADSQRLRATPRQRRQKKT